MINEFEKMNDKEVLNWFYERLKYQYKELENTNHMKRLSVIIDKTSRI